MMTPAFSSDVAAQTMANAWEDDINFGFRGAIQLPNNDVNGEVEGLRK
jgi:hypothetical protein